MAQLPELSLSPDAKAIVDKISAKRGPMRGGPYASLMHHPGLAEKVADLGEFLRHVLAYESIPQALFEQVRGEVGVNGVAELVALAGHYRLIAGVLFAFDTPLPDGTPAPF